MLRFQLTTAPLTEGGWPVQESGSFDGLIKLLALTEILALINSYIKF